MIVGINQAQEKIISEILKNYFGEFEFFYYGSRVKGGFEATSDLDILVKEKAEISKNSLENSSENSSENSPKTRREILEQIKEKFDQSLLPFIVNLTDYFRVEKKFYQAIKPDLVRVGGEVEITKINFLSVPITNLFYLKQGTYLKPSEMKKNSSKEFRYPVYGANGVIGYSDQKMYSEQTTLISCRGANCGVIHFTKPNSWISNNSIACIPKIKLDPVFYYYLCSNISFDDVITGSAQPQITITNLSTKKLIHPPLLTQQKIADILSAYDDLIENNNRRIKILEEMAQKLYKEWFVNFKFPGHQNAKFVDSALGKIPEGWEVVLANDVTNILIGRTPPRKENHWFSNEKSDNLPWLSIRDLGANHIFTGATSEYLTKEAVLKHNVPMVKKNTVLVSFKLTVGKVAIATEDICTNEAIAQFPIADSSHLTTYFLYSYLVDFKYPSLGNTSSIGNAVNSTILKNMPILIPPKNLVEEYTRFVAPVFKNIKIFLSQNQTLRQTRDILLPRLISGELSVENLKVKK